MKFEKILNTDDIEAVPLEKRTTFLFGYKRWLLDHVSSGCQRRIFDCRQQIANVFRQYGGERLESTAELFESLTAPNDLLQHAPSIPDRIVELQRKHISHIYTPGDEDGLTHEEKSAIHRAIAKKHPGVRIGGNHHVVNFKGLVELAETKRKNAQIYGGLYDYPVYIYAPLTLQLVKQIQVLIAMYPQMESRMFYLNDSDGELKPEPMSQFTAQFPDEQFGQALTMPGDLELLRKFFTEKPQIGDIVAGIIRKVVDFGVFVEFLPGTEGLVHVSELADSRGGCNEFLANAKEGDKIVVKIIDMDGRSGKIKLSAREANEDIQKGKVPVFAIPAHLKLLAGGF